MKYFNTKRTILAGALCLSLIGFASCQDDTVDMNGLENADRIPMKTVTNQATLEVISQLKKDAPDAIIAHRGSTFWTPEETEAAFRWARNMGADYLEVDIQRSSDGVLLALHDNNLRRTSNIESVYPARVDADISNFTLKELRALDAGTWFNEDKTDNARQEFVNQKISTLEDVLMIAEGNRVKRELNGGNYDADGKPFYQEVDGDGNVIGETTDLSKSNGHFIYEVDALDNGNRPGVYPETKEPWRFSGMEADLAKFLKKHGWLSTDATTLKNIPTQAGKVGVANTKSRIILQTFSWQSMQLLEKNLPNVPKCMLLWKGGYDNLAGDTPEMIADVMDFCVDNNVHIVGPSIGGAPNKYDDITAPWMCKMYHRPGFLIHAYSFDTQDQLKKYNGDYYYEKTASRFDDANRVLANEWKGNITRDMFIDAGFTNLTDLSLKYQGRAQTNVTAESVLVDLGYETKVGRK